MSGRLPLPPPGNGGKGAGVRGLKFDQPQRCQNRQYHARDQRVAGDEPGGQGKAVVLEGPRRATLPDPTEHRPAARIRAVAGHIVQSRRREKSLSPRYWAIIPQLAAKKPGSSIGTAGWARNRGLGALVTRLASADGLAAGSRWVYLGVFVENATASAIYRRSGFRRVGQSCPDLVLI